MIRRVKMKHPVEVDMEIILKFVVLSNNLVMSTIIKLIFRIVTHYNAPLCIFPVLIRNLPVFKYNCTVRVKENSCLKNENDCRLFDTF